MEELKKNLQIMYFVTNGFSLSILLILLGFEKTGGFLHYSPGLWLDITILISLIVIAGIVPFLSKKLINGFDKSAEDKLKLFAIVRIVAGWLTFGLLLLSYLYQTSLWLRYISVVLTIYALWLTYPTMDRLNKMQAAFD